tara:strand:+ start:8780 stop:10531 length:1752 start_codon:yes stop_codon:yes gene_type:complete
MENSPSFRSIFINSGNSIRMTSTEVIEIPENIRSKYDPRSLVEWFFHWEKGTPDRVFLRQPNGDQWIEYTWKQVGDEARRMTSYLKSQGLVKGDHVGLISKNCSHWIIADLAIMMGGYISVPLYPNLVGEQLNQVLEHSEVKLLFVGKVDEWDSMKKGIPETLPCLTLPESHVEDYDKWQDIIAKNDPLTESDIPDEMDLCTIIYTSGTTGSPKGVMYNHKQLKFTAAAAKYVINFGDKRHRYFSYLPLCHVAERMIIELGALHCGGVISFAESLDTFMQNLSNAQPTMFFAVPRIWTKFQMGVWEKMPQSKLDFLLKLPIISGIVKKKIRIGLGINEAEYCLTAAAPCPPSLHKWYNALGIQLLELYGMTENVGACTLMHPDNVKMGTVGQPYRGSVLKIEEETGEILMQAPWLMQGYYKEPAMTASVLKNGFLHTGDMGEIDDEGFLKITGRVKDTFKTSKGEYIVPGPIEWGYSLNGYIEQICVLGRGLPQPVALVVISDKALKKNRVEVEKSLVDTMNMVNKDLVDYERVRKVIVMKEPWTMENGILTPKMSIKRNVLEGKYEENLQTWYATENTVIWT